MYRWQRHFELDLRSLAVFRIGIGLLIVIDNIFRLQDLTAHYSDAGILPISLLMKLDPPQGISFHTLSGSPLWSLFLFIVSSVIALAFAAGWRTRWTGLACWAFAVSLQYRNPAIIDGGDVLLRCMLFWSLFLPLGKVWSLDEQRSTKKTTNYRSFSLVNFLFPLQLFLLYFNSGLLKNHSDWWPDGTAIGYTLSLNQFATPFGEYLTRFPEFLKHLTHAVYFTELLGGFLLLGCGWFRAAGVFLFMAFHAGLEATMDLAIFPWLACVCLFALMPTEVWDWWTKKRTPAVKFSFHFAHLLAAPFVVGALAWNIASYYRVEVADWVRTGMRFVHLDQYWGMFAPYPLKDAGWFEFGVQQWDGDYLYTFVDPRAEAEWDRTQGRPKSVYKYYVDQRWKKYLLNIWDKDYLNYRPALAAYLCSQWNKSVEHPSLHAVSVDLGFTLFENEKYLEPARGPASVDLGTFNCKE